MEVQKLRSVFTVISVDGWLGVRLRSVMQSLGVVLVFTSMVDLFVNRLVFRAGPDVVSRVSTLNPFVLGVFGRIIITLEQFLLFALLAFAGILLIGENRLLARVLGALLLTIMALSALLYFPLSTAVAWATSTLLVLVVGVTVAGLAWFVIRRYNGKSRKLRLAYGGFLFCVVLSFIFPLYYRTYLLLGAVSIASLPFPLDAYLLALYSVMAASLAAFVYAVQAPSPGFSLGPRNLLKAVVLPSLLILPIFYGVLQSFFMAQILSMVVAMSTDLIMSHDLLKALVAAWWFLLTAIMILYLKGRHSTNTMLRQESVGLILLMSTTLLFNYPYYLMLGVAGVLLLCYPLEKIQTRVNV